MTIALERDDVARTQLLIDPDEAAAQLRDFELSRDIAEHLCRHYPDWPWAVTAMAGQGVINVFNFALSRQIGFRLKMRTDADGPTAMRKAAVEAGGTLLEAFSQRRGRMPEGGPDAIDWMQFYRRTLPGGEKVASR